MFSTTPKLLAQFYSSPEEALHDVPDEAKLLVGGNIFCTSYCLVSLSLNEDVINSLYLTDIYDV